MKNVNPKHIHAIVFDIGGVLLNIDEKRSLRAFSSLGFRHIEKNMKEMAQCSFFARFEKGEMAPAEFRSVLKRHLPVSVSDAEIDNAWNATLIDFPKERMELLYDLKSAYSLFLLSNTNAIHLKAFLHDLEVRYGLKDLQSLFVKTYYSCCVGMRKPDKELFRLVMEENNLQPEEVMYIDDTAEHIQAASQIGWRAYHLQRGRDVCGLFHQFISSG